MSEGRVACWSGASRNVVVWGFPGERNRPGELLVGLEWDGSPRDLETLSLTLEGLTERTSEADRCCARLYHNHVPKLEANGLVRYDDESDLVELTDRGASLARTIAQ